MSALTEPAFQAPPPPPTPEQKPPRATHLWPLAIGSFVLGLLVLVASIVNIIPRGWGTAAGFCLLGVVLFALSFIRMPAVPQKEEPLSLLQKVTGIFFEPSRVFRNLREHPRWIGAFVIIALLSAIYSYAFVQRITPERIAEHTMERMGDLGNLVPPERREAAKAEQLDAMKNPVRHIAATVNVFPLTFIVTAFVAALGMLGVIAFGGRINFWQALASVFYAALPVVVLNKVLGLVILYLKAPEDLHPVLNRDTTLQDNLGILLSPADHPVLFSMATVIGLTSFYGLWLRAKGYNQGATRASSGVAWGVAIIQWVLWLLFLVTLAVLFPSFLS